MRVVIAPDKFKGTATALEVASAMRLGVIDVYPDADIELLPIADGGDGFISVLTRIGATLHTRRVSGPIGDSMVEARIALLGDRAFIESAEVIGLRHVVPTPETSLTAHTRGLGQLVLEALAFPIRELVVGLGGSATTDCGAGMLRELGASLSDADGEMIGDGGAALARIDHIDVSTLDQRLRRVRLIAATDVGSPLVGPSGAARTFAPQKGADQRAVEILEAGLQRFADKWRSESSKELDALPGAGAAGGLGAALGGVLDAELVGGAELISTVLGLETAIAGAALVITGEGSFDDQTLSGKGPYTVLRMAAQSRVPALVVCGRSELPPQVAQASGASAVLALKANFNNPTKYVAARVRALTRRGINQIGVTPPVP